MDQLHQSILESYKILQPYIPTVYRKSVRTFLLNPDNVPILLGTLIAGILLPFLLSYVCCGSNRGSHNTRSKTKLPPSAVPVEFDRDGVPVKPSSLSSARSPKHSSSSPSSDYVLICTLCKVDVHPGLARVHTNGKKHLKAAETIGTDTESSSPSSSSTSASSSSSHLPSWLWMNANDGESFIGKPCKHHLVDISAYTKEKNKKNKHRNSNDDDDSDSDNDNSFGTNNNSSGSTSNANRSNDNNDTLRLQGKGVVVVGSSSYSSSSSSSTLDMMNPTMEEGWSIQGNGNHHHSSSSSSFSQPVSTAKKQGNILSNLLYMEGGTNILQGFYTYENFIQPNAESLLRTWIYDTIRIGQNGRLRGNTYTSSYDTFPTVLNYGTYYDWLNATPVTSKLVEPIPTQINDFGRKIAAKLNVLGGLPVNPQGTTITSSISSSSAAAKHNKDTSNHVPSPDSVSIYILRKGQYLPPHALSSSFFGRPYCMLILGNEEDEDYLIGLRITPLNDKGEYASGYSSPLKRRNLLTFRDLVSQRTQQCIPSIRSNECIVIVFRYMSSTLHGEMQARGNVM